MEEMDESDEELKRLMTESPSEGPTGVGIGPGGGGGGGGGDRSIHDGNKPPTANSSTTSIRQTSKVSSGVFKTSDSVRSTSKEKVTGSNGSLPKSISSPTQGGSMKGTKDGKWKENLGVNSPGTISNDSASITKNQQMENMLNANGSTALSTERKIPAEGNESLNSDENTRKSGSPVANRDPEKWEQVGSISNPSNYTTESSMGSPVGDDMFPKPKWHPPWQLKQEIVAHESAIPVLIIDPSNRWFATGSSDHVIKIWDIEDYRLKLTIKAHKQSIRSMTFGTGYHRYLYSTGDDRQLLCHDVEVNRVISRYKGQSTVIYCMCMYDQTTSPNVLVTGARDKLLRLYDTRTTKCVKQLRGHQNTVSSVLARNYTQQIVSGSHDGTLRVWDVAEGKCTTVLYGHSKSIRTMCQHPVENTVLSASSERIIGWDIDRGENIHEIQARDIAINSITINRLGVTVAGGSNGVMHLWDFPSGFRFQKIHRTKVYESQEVPICVFSTKFDLSGTKLICSGACNVVKIYQEAFTRFRPNIEPERIQSDGSIGKLSPLMMTERSAVR